MIPIVDEIIVRQISGISPSYTSNNELFATSMTVEESNACFIISEGVFHIRSRESKQRRMNRKLP